MLRSTVLERLVGAGRYLFIGLTALAGGYVVSNAVEYWIDPGPGPETARRPASLAPGSASAREPARRGTEVSAIFERNLFGTDEEAVVVAAPAGRAGVAKHGSVANNDSQASSGAAGIGYRGC